MNLVIPAAFSFKQRFSFMHQAVRMSQPFVTWNFVPYYIIHFHTKVLLCFWIFDKSILFFSLTDWKLCTTFDQEQMKSKWLQNINKRIQKVRVGKLRIFLFSDCACAEQARITAENSFRTVSYVTDLCLCAFVSLRLTHLLCVLCLVFVLVPLDKPEEFLLQIHKMDHFAERLECWLYRNKFTETLTAIGKAMSIWM